MRRRLLPVGEAVVKDLPAVKKVYDMLKAAAAFPSRQTARQARERM